MMLTGCFLIGKCVCKTYPFKRFLFITIDNSRYGKMCNVDSSRRYAVDMRVLGTNAFFFNTIWVEKN